MKHHNYYVYIVTNPTGKVLYTGVTNDLERRLCEHYLNRDNEKTFAGKYHCYNLLYYERYQYIRDAIAREKKIKGWTRNKKNELIQSENKEFKVLNELFCHCWPPPEEVSA
jgi:putative endonuclease